MAHFSVSEVKPSHKPLPEIWLCFSLSSFDSVMDINPIMLLSNSLPHITVLFL
jgi:hypothetical protein